jgi:uncharacterized membrane protein YfcA
VAVWPNYPLEVWLLAGLAVIVIGISKAGFGSSVGVVATPLISMVLPVTEAVALLLPLLLAGDLFTVRHYRRTFDRPNLGLLLPSAVIGVVLGSLFFDRFTDQERVLKIGIGVVSLVFVIYQATRVAMSKVLKVHSPNRTIGALLGTFAGFTSTIAHVGGPAVIMYLLPQNLNRRVFVGTVAWLWLIINSLKLIPYGILGLLSLNNLLVVAVLLPLVYVGIRLGLLMIRLFSERAFNLFIYALLTLTGIQLLIGRSPFSLLAGP